MADGVRSPCQADLLRAHEVVAAGCDIIRGRVGSPAAPAWAQRRGWVEFLLHLPDAAVERCERFGLSRVVRDLPDVPGDLAALARDVRAIERRIGCSDDPCGGRPAHAVPGRKDRQVRAVLAASRSLPIDSVHRIVDVGAGHGHLTRELRRELGVPAIGLDRDPERVRRARELASGAEVFFEVEDVRLGQLALRRGDLAVGLHACGQLGDVLIEEALRARAHLALVSCCFQKISQAVRRPLSRIGRSGPLFLPRESLGLANLGVSSAGPQTAADMRGREVRYALRGLLEARGIELSPGAEAQGINRRRFRKGLAVVASQACARRGLGAPTARELERAAVAAQLDFPRVRRFSLPRQMLGRTLEIALVLDRASRLEEGGHDVRVFELFPRATSPRNLAIVSRAPSISRAPMTDDGICGPTFAHTDVGVGGTDHV